MGTMPSTRPVVTNEAVAKRLGLTHSAISRIRSGDRLPSFDTMVRIDAEYDWPIQDQTDARLLGSYHVEFERIINVQTPAA